MNVYIRGFEDPQTKLLRGKHVGLEDIARYLSHNKPPFDYFHIPRYVLVLCYVSFKFALPFPPCRVIMWDFLVQFRTLLMA